MRRAHYLFAASLFGILGFHVGVWAVQLAQLAAGLRLDPAKLGAAVTVAAAAGLVTLFAGGGRAAQRVRRWPRRPRRGTVPSSSARSSSGCWPRRRTCG